MWCGAEDATPFERVTLWETDEKTGAHTRKWDNECSVLRCISERLDPSAKVRCRPPARRPIIPKRSRPKGLSRAPIAFGGCNAPLPSASMAYARRP